MLPGSLAKCARDCALNFAQRIELFQFQELAVLFASMNFKSMTSKSSWPDCFRLTASTANENRIRLGLEYKPTFL